MKQIKWGQRAVRLLNSLRTKRILVRMLAGYISILLVILCFNVIIYFYLKPILLQEKVDSTRNYLTYIGQQTDMQLLEAKSYMHKFLEESVPLREKETGGEINRQIALTRDLIYMMASCPLIEYAAVYDAEDPNVITSDGTLGREALIEKIAQNTALSKEEVKVSITTNKHFDYFPVRTDSAQTNALVLYTGVSYSSTKDYKMVAFISSGQIRDMLTNATVEESARTYIVNQNNDVQLSVEGDILDKALISQDGRYGNHTLVVLDSEFQDWSYVSVLDDERIVQNLGFLKNIFLLLISMMLVICLTLSIRFTKLYYTPISNIIDNYMLSLHSGKTEFEAISETLDFLRAKNQQAQEKEVLSGILQSGFYEEDMEQLFSYSLYRVAVVQSGQEHIEENVVTGFFLNEAEIACKVVYNQHDGCTLILNGNDLEDSRILELLLRLQKMYAENYQVFMAFGVSGLCEQIMDLHETYREAALAIEYGDSSRESCVYMNRDLVEANQSLYMPIEFERKMTECVYVRNYDGIRALIEDIFRQNRGVPNVYLHSIVMNMCNAYENICKKLDNTSKLSGDIINHEYRVPVIREHLTEVFTSLEGDLVKENRIEAVRNYVTMYIAENYSDPTVSIETIADDIQLSTSYVSTLFKKAEGIAFSQYLLQYRIDMAKELLKNSGEKISTISERAGFGTYNNFVRMFKRKTGLSPSQYRLVNQQMKGNESNGHL